jgi:hypothetical protein
MRYAKHINRVCGLGRGNGMGWQWPRTFRMDHAYWGGLTRPGKSAPSYVRMIFPIGSFNDEGALLDEVVDRLMQGKVVSWFQGRFEWGPRALGNRGILADARSPEIKATAAVAPPVRLSPNPSLLGASFVSDAQGYTGLKEQT